jgi:phosphoribosylglycinamide formyltransferase-1
MKRIAIFASGSGSNAENIYNYFQKNENIAVSLILTNNPKAGVIERAKRLNIPYIVFYRKEFYVTDKIIDALLKKEIDFIVLAGFLWLLPSSLLEAFPNKIINIHPALLPKFGGKGMYGQHVHKAVSAAKEIKTGITIHYVNEQYDEGAVIFQKAIGIEKGEEPASIAAKIHALEYEFFPKVIEELLS